MPFLEMYSGFVHLDFDKLTPEQLDTAFKVIAEITYTFLCFISPSGNGLKVFVEVNTGIEHHDTAYLQVQQFYEEATGLNADPSCKDITRLCFMSYHPGLYKNIRNEKFKVQLPEAKMQEPVKETTEPFSPPHQSESISKPFQAGCSIWSSSSNGKKPLLNSQQSNGSSSTINARDG